MYELPDEIWNLIKEFALDWKGTHMRKLDDVFGMMYICSDEWGEIHERWTHFPPPPIITAHLNFSSYSLNGRGSDLPLTSITWNPKENEKGGWWCGYGWNGWPDLRERDEWKEYKEIN